ncbi:MAG TPA: hypothetical protein VGO43_10370 [Pyrinomonadaceae bacterium]|jgi:hypothetical protein|nr:hypothetical protein [Pyrinomonadaceae bacterium]
MLDRKIVAVVVAVLCMLFADVAFAQNNGRRRRGRRTPVGTMQAHDKFANMETSYRRRRGRRHHRHHH